MTPEEKAGGAHGLGAGVRGGNRAGGHWGEVGGTRAPRGRRNKAENTVITHPGLFLSGPLAAGGRDQLGFVALSRVIQWWSGPFL